MEFANPITKLMMRFAELGMWVSARVVIQTLAMQMEIVSTRTIKLTMRFAEPGMWVKVTAVIQTLVMQVETVPTRMTKLT
jgi:hypothetical protein